MCRLIISTIVSLSFGIAASFAQSTDVVPGRLLLKQRRDVSPTDLSGALQHHHARLQRRIHGPTGVIAVGVPAASAEAVAASLRKSGLFDYVEPDHYAHTGAIPNDPSFPNQWHLAKIQAPAAWDINRGTATIAIVDSGVDATHPDLRGKVIAGWNFVHGNSDTSDLLGHGTAVAGTAAATVNNGTGVAGVSWNSVIMPVVVVNANDVAMYSDMANGIYWAADHGARVINMSVGGSSPSAALQGAVDYAWSKGAVVFASAMNNSTSTPYYPAACNRAVAVSATDVNDALASFSNYGSWITLSAPGNSILTTNRGGGYGYWYGTSFASPIVAGVAALALSASPSLTAEALVSLLKESADDVGVPGFDTSFGSGRVNAYRALRSFRESEDVKISISPATATLPSGTTQQFKTEVTGTSNTAVTWNVTGVGTISADGLYTAPSVTAEKTAQITATSIADSTKSASATVTINPPPTFNPIRVNSGGPAYTDSQGATWSGDAGYAGGNTWAIWQPIGNTTTSALYQTCRYGPFTYLFSVPNGTYTVNLKFAEVTMKRAGQRVFSVALNGTTVLQNFDVFAAAGDALMALDRQFVVPVTNGRVWIEFLNGSANSPLVSAIEIMAGVTKAADSTRILVNAGGPAYADPQGALWSIDTAFAGGYTWSIPVTITHTDASALYQTCRYGVFTYRLSIPNGLHVVTLKFAEVSMNAAGKRVFNVAINGTPVLQNFDVFAAAGGAYIAIDKQFPVSVTGGGISIQFTNGTANSPLVNAIEIG